MHRLIPLFFLMAIGCGNHTPSTTAPNPSGDEQVEAWRVDKARALADEIQTAIRFWMVRNEGEAVPDLEFVAPFLEEGEKGLIDPWGGKFQLAYFEDQHTGRVRPFVWAVQPKTGKKIGSPRDFEDRK